MSKVSLISTVAALLFASCTPKVFTIIQISDTQIGFLEEAGQAEGDSLLKRTVGIINRMNPDLLLITGDMVNVHDDKDQISRYQKQAGLLDPSIPVYHLPGNHDIGHDIISGQREYLAAYGYDRFSLRKRRCQLIGLNSNLIKYDNAQQEDQEQFEWLSSELQKSDKERFRLVFMHHPPFVEDEGEEESWRNLPKDKRERYLRLMREHKVSALFTGHLHYYKEIEVGDFPIIVCGASGKPLGPGVSGINVIRISRDSWTNEFIPLDEADSR